MPVKDRHYIGIAGMSLAEPETLRKRMRSKLASSPRLRRIRRSVLSRRIAASTLRCYLYDWRRYVRYWHGVGIDDREGQRERAILKAYHAIEKGLSLQEPRPGFGQPKIRALMRLIDNQHGGLAESEAAMGALSALRAYRRFNAVHGVTLDWLDEWLIDKPAALGRGGTRTVTREELQAAVSEGGGAFFASRHSMRQFGPDPVPMEDIRRAVGMAQKTPSACNRQGFYAHAFANAQTALRFQPGNMGFGHLASRALVVTADLHAFSGPGERNQAWIDGGMFAMSILYALHALGYGACPLAWSQMPANDHRARQALGLPDNEVIIMMIAIGTFPERFEVAFSQRLAPGSAFIEHTIDV